MGRARLASPCSFPVQGSSPENWQLSDEERRVLFEKIRKDWGETQSLSMSDKPILFNARRERVDVESLIDSCRSDPNRILGR